jgi:beta propeller repeat protein
MGYGGITLNIKTLFFTLLVTGVLYTSMGSLYMSSERSIISQPGDQRCPALYQDMIVYQDNRNGNWDIYGYNLETGEEFQITTDPNDQIYPDIYGNVVVWLDKRDLGKHIYAYDLFTGKEWKISQMTAKGDPSIFENIIVWSSDSKPSQIIGYDIETRTEFFISKSEDTQYNPDVYDSFVVWEQEHEYTTTIHGYDLKKQKKYSIGKRNQFFYSNHDQVNPVIYENIVIWVNEWDDEIYGQKIDTHEDLIIADAELHGGIECYTWDLSQEPAVDENTVVWVDCRNGNKDIFGLDLASYREFQITFDDNIQQSPALYSTMVIWEDDRNGNWDIHAYDLSSPLQYIPAPSRSHLVTHDLFLNLEFLFVVIGAFLIQCMIIFRVVTFNKISKKVPWSKTHIREFRRDIIPLSIYYLPGIFFGLIAVLNFIFYGFHLNGIIFIGLFLFHSGSLLWITTIPGIRTTDQEILFYRFPFGQRRLKWIDINKIIYDQGKKRVLIQYDDRYLHIYLNHIDEEDRDDFLTTLRYPLIEGIEFEYND